MGVQGPETHAEGLVRFGGQILVPEHEHPVFQDGRPDGPEACVVHIVEVNAAHFSGDRSGQLTNLNCSRSSCHHFPSKPQVDEMLTAPRRT